MPGRPKLLGGLTLAIALVLTFLKIPLASSQGLTLVVSQLADELPVTDPDSPLWEEATAVEVPLSAQMIAKPYFPDTKIKAVTARALYNDVQIALLVEWSDETQNDQTIRVQDFRDGVALQFPLAEAQPYFCMGQDGGNVNIWHWKADWQADIAARQNVETAYPDMYVDQHLPTDASGNVLTASYDDPQSLTALAAGNLFAARTRLSPVEDIVAGGFSTLTAQPGVAQNVQGHGSWANGKWRVIFSRELASAETDDISFVPNKVHAVAFAAWDGANSERNGTKSTSQWVSLQLKPAAAARTVAESGGSLPGPSGLFWGGMILFLLMIMFGGLIYARLPRS